MEQYSANLFRSSVTQKDVDAVIVKYQILSSINLRPPFETDRACSCLENEVCLYIGSFEGGLRLPFPKIVREVLEFYGLAPAQITPNSWRHLIVALFSSAPGLMELLLCLWKPLLMYII